MYCPNCGRMLVFLNRENVIEQPRFITMRLNFRCDSCLLEFVDFLTENDNIDTKHYLGWKLNI